MTKYLMTLAAMMMLLACSSGNTKTPVDNELVDDNTAITDDSSVADNAVDTEQPDIDTDSLFTDYDTEQPDIITDDLKDESSDSDTMNVNDTTDIESPDIDYFGTGTPGEMVEVPSGEFWMGCNEAVDSECYDDEYPYHAVILSAYKINKYEVTVEEYQECVDAGACNNFGNYTNYYTNSDDPYCNYDMEGKEKHPMQCVTWYGAKAYCEYVGQRLPTEAEWEKAARGTDGRKYPWGNEGFSCDYAVMNDSNAGGKGCGTDSTWPVGNKTNGVSPYGVYDMAGNVMEWVNDRYASDDYSTLPTNNPTGPESGNFRVLRGGSWVSDNDRYLRASSRNYGFPYYSYDPYNGYYSIGFRCAE